MKKKEIPINFKADKTKIQVAACKPPVIETTAAMIVSTIKTNKVEVDIFILKE